MRYAKLFVVACTLAAFVPWVPGRPSAQLQDHAFPGWPTQFEGRSLTPVPLSAREQAFTDGFPGRMAIFSDGTRTILFRWVTAETRQLHAASDCFRGSGYHVSPLPLRKDGNDLLWGAFRATRGLEVLHVSERISDTAGNSWTDVSAWYWAALKGTSQGPWWAMTVVRVGQGDE
jgi:hypothetical protein